jgi:3'(2'), 5'-bisphosphate nucleotidase
VTILTLERDAALALLAPLTDLVAQAGLAILAINRKAMAVTDKSDGSPVTEADLAANSVIAAGLKRLAPDVPVMSEERTTPDAAPYKGSFFLVDPLDGTREFLAGRGEFTVNVALISHNQPLLGVIGAPALGLIWRGVVGHRAEKLPVATDGKVGDATPIRTRPHPQAPSPWLAAVSRSHGDARTEAFIDARPGASRVKLGSAIKFCQVAEGGADIYPRLAPTSEWDVAAGQALLVAAGGCVTNSHGEMLHFGAKNGDFLVPEFIAWGDPTRALKPQ